MVEKEHRTGSQGAAYSGSSAKGCYFRQVLTSGLLPHLNNNGIGLDDLEYSYHIKIILRYPLIF